MNNFDYASDPLLITSGNTTLTVKIADSADNEQVTLHAERYGGVASVDIREVVQAMYRNVQTELSNSHATISIKKDMLLQVPCKIKVDNGAPTDYTFLRGVHQLGESGREYIATRLGVEIIKDPSVDIHIKARYYVGYPLCLTLTHDDQCDIIINQQQTVYQSDYASHVCLSPSTDIGVDIRDYNNWVQIDFNSKAVPANPFYVRWINRFGGWETFMFSCNRKHTRQLKANDYFEQYGAEGIKTSYHKEGVEVVEVSSGIVTKDVFDELAWLKFSPIIQLYNPTSGTWTNIQIDKGDDEIYSTQPTGEMIISFVLPEIQILK